MNPQLHTAILEFLGNEFKISPGDLIPETNFFLDLNLTPDQLSDLLQRLQDALNIILPEDKVPQISTIGDIFSALENEPAEGEPEL